MFNRASIHGHKSLGFIALLAAIMVGLAAALPSLVYPSPASASHGVPGDAPGKVTGVSISEEQEVAGVINVAWDAATPGAAPITDYILYVVNTADESDNQTGTVTTSGPNPLPGELEHSFAGLRSGATYEVKVRARNLIGERGPWSDAVQITLSGG